MERRNGNMVRNLAHELLTKEECRVLKDAMKQFRDTRSLPSFVTILQSILTDQHRLLLLVELGYMMPDGLKGDFNRLCMLQFPGYREIDGYIKRETLSRYTEPHVIAQNESGTIRIVGDKNNKKIVVKNMNIQEETKVTNMDKNVDSFKKPKPKQLRQRASVSSYSDTDSDYSGYHVTKPGTSLISHVINIGHEPTNQLSDTSNNAANQMQSRRGRQHVDPTRVIRSHSHDGSLNHSKTHYRSNQGVARNRLGHTRRSETRGLQRRKNNFNESLLKDIDLDDSVHDKSIDLYADPTTNFITANTLQNERTKDSCPIPDVDAVPFSHLANNVEINTRYSNNAHKWRDLRKLTLYKRPGESLGFCIRGGHELHTGIYVSHIDSGGQAQTQGLRVGDRIFKVNSCDFRKITHVQAVIVVKNCQNKVTLYVTSAQSHKMPGRIEILHSPRATQVEPIEKEILIQADPDGWLGCSIRGGIDQKVEVLISNVDPDSPAQRAGLKKRDRIIKLNGMDVSNLTHLQVVNLATLSPEVRMVVIPGIKYRKEKERRKQEKELLSFEPQERNQGENIPHNRQGLSQATENDITLGFADGLLMSPNAMTSTPLPPHYHPAPRKSMSSNNSQSSSQYMSDGSTELHVIVADVHAENDQRNPIQGNHNPIDNHLKTESNHRNPNSIQEEIEEDLSNTDDIIDDEQKSNSENNSQTEISPKAANNCEDRKQLDKYISGTIKKNLDIGEDLQQKLSLGSPAKSSPGHEHIKNIFDVGHIKQFPGRKLSNEFTDDTKKYVSVVEVRQPTCISNTGDIQVYSSNTEHDIGSQDQTRDSNMSPDVNYEVSHITPRESPQRYTIWSSRQKAQGKSRQQEVELNVKNSPSKLEPTVSNAFSKSKKMLNNDDYISSPATFHKLSVYGNRDWEI